MKHFIVTLQDEVIISRHAATLGGQGSLDYLPGAVFMGIAAGKLYRTFGANKAYTAFHSGKVRFGNALLLSPAGVPAYPVPLSWYSLSKEYEQALNDLAPLDPAQISNKLFSDEGRKQLSRGYVTLDKTYLKPDTELRMKTAINPKTGRAADQQLFGYAALPAGLRFHFTLAADADAQDLLPAIADSLVGTRRIGRSRSAEYGRVVIEEVVIEEKGDAPAYKPDSAFQADTCAILLLSDTALLDNNGQPTLTPSPEHFGLSSSDGSQFDLPRSFIRSRRYAPFNAHYRKREQERLVLRMGSVLTFKVADGFDAAEHAEKLAGGVGLFRQAGLGQVWVNPPLLVGEQPSFFEQAPVSYPPKQLVKEKAEKPPLIAWLEASQAQHTAAQEAERIADDWAKSIKQLYVSARQLAGAPAGVRTGPSPSQWGRVMSLAKSVGISAEELQNKLFKGESAVCKENDPDWKVDVWPQDKTNPLSFREWFQNCCECHSAADNFPAILALTARQATNIARAEEGETQHVG